MYGDSTQLTARRMFQESESARIREFTEIAGDMIPNNLITALIDRGFFTAPAGMKHHGNFEGGLYWHSKNVADLLGDYTKRLDLEWQNGRSPFVIGFLHDVCKMDYYKKTYTREMTDYSIIEGSGTDLKFYNYEWNDEQFIPGHADKSLIFIGQYMNLTDEEVACIRWHMGAFDDRNNWKYYNEAVSRWPNILYTHTADMMAAKVWER